MIDRPSRGRQSEQTSASDKQMKQVKQATVDERVSSYSSAEKEENGLDIEGTEEKRERERERSKEDDGFQEKQTFA